MRRKWADGLRRKAKQQSSDKKPGLSEEKRERERKREKGAVKFRGGRESEEINRLREGERE